MHIKLFTRTGSAQPSLEGCKKSMALLDTVLPSD